MPKSVIVDLVFWCHHERQRSGSSSARCIGFESIIDDLGDFDSKEPQTTRSLGVKKHAMLVFLKGGEKWRSFLLKARQTRNADWLDGGSWVEKKETYEDVETKQENETERRRKTSRLRRKRRRWKPGREAGGDREVKFGDEANTFPECLIY